MRAPRSPTLGRAAACSARCAPPAGIDLSSNDYLTVDASAARATRLDRGASSARAAAAPARGCCAASATCFAAVERAFAAFKGTERVAVFLERLPGQHRRADDACRAGRRDLLGRAQPRQPDRRHPAVAAPRASCFRTTTSRRLARAARGHRRRGVRRSSSSSRCSAWTATSRRSPSTRRSAGGRRGARSSTKRTPSASTAQRGSGLIEAAGIEPTMSACRSTRRARRSASAARSSPGPPGRSTI